MSSPTPRHTAGDVTIREMREGDLPEVSRIVRVAFGTFFGLSDPEVFWPDRDPVTTRWRADPGAAMVADVNGDVAGSNFATDWGSFGFFGPLSIEPAFWNLGIAQKLLVRTMDMFERWGVKEAGLYTFAQSPKHIALYQKFGFWPRFLTALMAKDIGEGGSVAFVEFSTLSDHQRMEALRACRELTDRIFEGLDVSIDIVSVQSQRLGETVLLWGGDSLDAFAVCHCGPGTEAGEGKCYVKFAAVRPGANAKDTFDRLLAACESMMAMRGLYRVEAGINMARGDAYRTLLRHGFRAQAQGVAMQRPDSPGFNRPDVWVIDDWR